ncbi:hypothetical protein HMPREF1584_01269 [Gardnerella vaginalis JCP8481A]|nr:hypothetical protein HMPREF1584_01269 [Gardnerella vaginalis JCP8481A]
MNFLLVAEDVLCRHVVQYMGKNVGIAVFFVCCEGIRVTFLRIF